MKRILVALVFTAATFPALAEMRTVTLSVPGMNCAACPITVKKALSRVPGVSKTEVRLDHREAIVTFEDARATVDDLTRATKDAGYPSSVVGHAT